MLLGQKPGQKLGQKPGQKLGQKPGQEIPDHLQNKAVLETPQEREVALDKLSLAPPTTPVEETSEAQEIPQGPHPPIRRTIHQAVARLLPWMDSVVVPPRVCRW